MLLTNPAAPNYWKYVPSSLVPSPGAGSPHYSEDMRANAHSCSQVLGDAEVKAQMSAGMEKFDYDERERGHDTMCSDVANDFSQWLQR